MKLIGMLDSPFVRRVAVTMNHYRMSYEHQAISVYGDYEEFKVLSPIVKAPTLLLKDGTRLIESSLIIEYLDQINASDATLHPLKTDDFVRCLEIVGIALAANEKSVQVMYERTMRSDQQRNNDWLSRVSEQLHSAYQLLEEKITEADDYLIANTISHADIAVTVAWGFTQFVVADLVEPRAFPKIARFAARMESFDLFIQSPIDHE